MGCCGTCRMRTTNETPLLGRARGGCTGQEPGHYCGFSPMRKVPRVNCERNETLTD
jgi:hypothetical protein